jgi:LmbE family N-acetylglucosaminyl deacetylase
MANTLLVLTTYVDEIPLHAGGLIANHAEAGDRVIVIAAYYPGWPSKVVYPEVDAANPYGRFQSKERYAREVCDVEVKEVAEALGISQVITWDYEGHREALFAPEAVDRLTSAINEYQPDIVVTHWPISDYSDFIGCGSAVLRAMIERRLTKMPQVYFSETLTGKHTVLFAPNVYVDISRTMHKKKAACEKIWQGRNVDLFYNPYALPIAHFRGRECGVAYAEAYAALTGTFGLEKQPARQPTPAGARPVSLRHAVELLDRKPMAAGTYPTYQAFDDEIAKKVFAIAPERRIEDRGGS